MRLQSPDGEISNAVSSCGIREVPAAKFQSPDGEIGNAVNSYSLFPEIRPQMFQSPDGEIGNAVLSLGFRMEYRTRCVFFSNLGGFAIFLPTRLIKKLRWQYCSGPWLCQNQVIFSKIQTS